MSDVTRTSIILENDLYDRLKRTAKASRRSMHAQILVFIEAGIMRDESVEKAVLASPVLMAAIRDTQEGSRAELRPWPEEAGPE